MIYCKYITVDNYFVPEERIELSWGCPRTILSRLRLPIPPLRLTLNYFLNYYSNPHILHKK